MIRRHLTITATAVDGAVLGRRDDLGTFVAVHVGERRGVVWRRPEGVGEGVAASRRPMPARLPG